MPGTNRKKRKKLTRTIAKYNKTLYPDKRVEDILTMTMNETGRPIILTTVSVVAGMCILLFGSFTPIRYFGLFMAVALTVAMLATLFILPVVILMFHKAMGRSKY